MAANLKTTDEDAAAPAAKKKAPMKLFTIVGVLLVFGAGFLIAKQMSAKQLKKPEKVEVGSRIVLDEFLINLADSTNDRYLKTTIALGLKKGISEEQFKDTIPQARDAVVMVLTTKKLEDVRTNDGKLKLKSAIVDAINKAAGKQEVVEVDFQTFATQ